MSLTVGMSSLTYRILNSMASMESSLDTTMTRLATGKRINTAKDDPRNLVALSKLNSDLVSVGASIDNNERSQAVLDTADSALAEVATLTAQIEQLVADANDPEATASQKAAYQNQIDEAIDSIDRLVSQASFGDKKLFSGDSAVSAADSGNTDLLDIRVYSIDPDATANKVMVCVTTNVATGTVTVDGNAATVERIKKEDGTDSDFARIWYTDEDYSLSFVMDVNDAAADDELTVTIGTNTGAKFRLGPDSTAKKCLDLGAGVTTAELGYGTLNSTGAALAGALSSLKTGGANTLTSANTQAAEIAKEASAQVALARSRVGSFNKYQVGTALNSLKAEYENLTAQIGTINDTDYAADSALLEQQNTRLSAMITLLSVANTTQSNTLALLR